MEGAKVCNYCGQEVKIAKEQNPKKGNPIVSIISLIIFIAIGAYSAFHEKQIAKNDEAVQMLDSQANYSGAISQLESALKNTFDSEEKMRILKNLGYAYWSDGNLEKAKENFQTAFEMAKKDSYDFYLLTGEISFLENDAKKAEENYLKAYEKMPDDFQINSSLGLFYLGFDEITADYVDYNKALGYNKKALEQNPDLETMKENLASNYYFLEQYDLAIDLYKQTSLESKPDNLYMIGLCYYGKEDDANAKIYLQKAKDAGYVLDEETDNFLTGENSI